MRGCLAPLMIAASLVGSGCSCGPRDVELDAGHAADASAGAPDGGDTGAEASFALRDGGTIIYGGGCVSPDRNKVIFILDSRQPQWCAYISLRRWDGGFPTLFPNFEAPEDFKVDDARFGVCRDLEQPTRLDPMSIPLDDLTGQLVWRFVLDGRPQTYDFDGGLRMGPITFSAQVYAALFRDCKGN